MVATLRADLRRAKRNLTPSAYPARNPLTRALFPRVDRLVGVDYVDMIDTLLDYVGQRVLVRVGEAPGGLGYVMLKGVLRQGAPGGDDPTSGAHEWDYFGVGDDDSSGVWLSRREFVSAEYADEALTIVFGHVAITVEPEYESFRPSAPSEPH